MERAQEMELLQLAGAVMKSLRAALQLAKSATVFWLAMWLI